MNATISLQTGYDALPIFEGEIIVRGIPRTEAAASCFTGAGVALHAAREMQRVARPLVDDAIDLGRKLDRRLQRLKRFVLYSDILHAIWIWSPKDEDVVLVVVARDTVDGTIETYVGFVR